MDWKMFDSAKRKNPKLPILILTEWISEDPHYHQADACFPKSHDTDRLKQKIKEIIEKRLPEKTGSKAALIFLSKGHTTGKSCHPLTKFHSPLYAP